MPFCVGAVGAALPISSKYGMSHVVLFLMVDDHLRYFGATGCSVTIFFVVFNIMSSRCVGTLQGLSGPKVE